MAPRIPICFATATHVRTGKKFYLAPRETPEAIMQVWKDLPDNCPTFVYHDIYEEISDNVPIIQGLPLQIISLQCEGIAKEELIRLICNMDSSKFTQAIQNGYLKIDKVTGNYSEIARHIYDDIQNVIHTIPEGYMIQLVVLQTRTQVEEMKAELTKLLDPRKIILSYQEDKFVLSYAR